MPAGAPMDSSTYPFDLSRRLCRHAYREPPSVLILAAWRGAAHHQVMSAARPTTGSMAAFRFSQPKRASAGPAASVAKAVVA